MEPENNSKINLSLGLILGVIVMAGVAFVSFFTGKKENDDDTLVATEQTIPENIPAENQPVVAQPSTPAPTPKPVTVPVHTPVPTPSPKPASVYKDGTYTATGSYMSPGGMDDLGVTVKITNDVITDVSVNPRAGDNTSERYMEMFASGYKQYVVGKNIAQVKLGKVSGSSLTPIGFNNALTQIKAQAKA